jgi:Recombination endonuclease VII
MAAVSPAAKAHRKKQRRDYARRPEVRARRRITNKAWAARCYGSENRYMRHRSYIARYGITIEIYEQMMKKQKDKCLLCDRTRDKGKHLAVDHDHATGRVRGLLCTFCNLIVARVDADRLLPQRLMEYCYGSNV